MLRSCCTVCDCWYPEPQGLFSNDSLSRQTIHTNDSSSSPSLIIFLLMLQHQALSSFRRLFHKLVIYAFICFPSLSSHLTHLSHSLSDTRELAHFKVPLCEAGSRHLQRHCIASISQQSIMESHVYAIARRDVFDTSNNLFFLCVKRFVYFFRATANSDFYFVLK